MEHLFIVRLFIVGKRIYTLESRFKRRLNTDASPLNFWPNFLENDLTKQKKKCTVAHAIAIPFPLYFSFSVLSHRFPEHWAKTFYF